MIIGIIENLFFFDQLLNNINNAILSGPPDTATANFEFSGNNLSSGMYLVKISSENDIQTQKVLLMK